MKNYKILGLLLLWGLTLSVKAQLRSDSLYKEYYRPQFHFSPQKGWIGDPSGFIYYQGKYHMFWWGKVASRFR
jgi:sucrose-6-phosphate hydrolase SacC (GH32 family)